MEESEAIEKLKNMRLYMQIEDENNDCKFTEDDYKANEMAIQVLEEVQQYRTIGTLEELQDMKSDFFEALSDWRQYRKIGTLEECRTAREKQIPKKPNKTIDSSWGVKKEVHTCPVCDYYLTEVHFIAPQKIESNKKITYCETCGQAIDWSDEE